MPQNEVRVVITGDSRQLGTALGQAAGDLDGFSARAADIGGKIKGVGQSLTMGLTLPIIGLGVLFGQELGEAERVAAQTASAIKSTGGVAGVTASDVAKLSESLMEMSGVDDEAIASGQNLLLTFTNLRNGVGEGNDIFDQATRAALDMSVAMGSDMSTAAMQVGKALNDPIAGVGALRRVGVQLSEQQQQQIQDFMAVGDVASAQKIILGELATQFGGSAAAAGETASGQFARFRETLMNVGAEILTSLMPAFERLTGWLQRAADWFGNLSPQWQTFIAIAAAVAAALGPVLIVVGSLVTALPALGAALGAIFSPVGLVIAAIVALGAGLVWLYKNNEGFREWVQSVASTLRDWLGRAMEWITTTAIPALRVAFDWLMEKGREVAAWISENFGPVIESMGELVQAAATRIGEVIAWLRQFWADHGDQILATWSRIWEGVRAVVGPILNAIRGIIEGALQAIRGVIQVVTGLISGDWSTVWEGIRNVFGGVWNAIYAAVSGVLGAIWGAIRSTVEWIWGYWSGMWGRIRDFVAGIWGGIASAVSGGIAWMRGVIVGGFNGVVDFVSSIPGRITGFFSNAGSWLTSAGRRIMEGLLQGIRDAWNRVAGWLDGVADLIKSHKGPIEYDAKLLIPEGRAIMESLGRGLTVGFDAEVRPVVSGITGELGGNWQASGAAYSPVIAAGQSVELHFHGPVSRDAEGWLLDVIARANRRGLAAIPGVA